MAREALLEQRQQERSQSVHRAASTLRARQTAAVSAKKIELQNHRCGTTDGVKQHRAELRQQRNDQEAQWKAHGKELNNICVATRSAAQHAKNQMRERNLSEAHRSTAELLELFRQGAESQTQFNDAKQLMSERVRREAGLNVVRSARTQASRERAKSASVVRRRSEHDALRAQSSRQDGLEARRMSSYRIELAASPDRVRQLKDVEAERKANLTGGLRQQNRALEALALERRSEEAQTRQRMHDAVMCARYGLPGTSLHAIKLASGTG